MLRFENVAKIGDIIRAYDFKPMRGRGDCFIEGEVIGLTDEYGYKAFKIVIDRAVFDSKELPKNELQKYGHVPMEVSFMEYDARVINLSK